MYKECAKPLCDFFKRNRQNIFLRAKKSRKTSQPESILRFCFVKIVERIFERHTPDAAEPGLLAKLADLRLVKTECAQSGPMIRQGRGHAIEHAYAMKHCTERIRVPLACRTVDSGVIMPPGRRARWDGCKLKWIDRVMHHIECRNHVQAFGSPFETSCSSKRTRSDTSAFRAFAVAR